MAFEYSTYNKSIKLIVKDIILPEDKKYRYIYILRNKVNNKYYKGLHRTYDLYDGYCGSGRYVSQSINKYGIENFELEIVEFFKGDMELFDAEKLFITLDEVNSSTCYNLKLGGFCFSSDPSSEEIKAKMKETKLLKGSWGNMDACRTEESVSKGVKTKRLKHDLYFIPINRVDKSGNIIKSYDTIYDAVDDIRSLGVECQAKKIARIFNSDIHHSHPRGYFWELQERSTTSLYGVDSSESKQETLLSEDIV
jgi:hypothetical protein